MAEPEPPNDDLGLVDAVVQLSFSVLEILGSIAAEWDLSLTQVRMLGILRDREPGMVELAGYLSLEKSSVTGLVDRAEQRGLVARTRDPDDGRGFRVQLTPVGHEQAAAFASRVEGRIAELFTGISGAERARLSRTASRVVTGGRVRRARS